MVITELTDITVAALQEQLTSHARVVVLDIRPAADYAEWHIPGSQHIDAYAQLKTGDSHALDAFDTDPAVPVVTVCGSGKVSQVAAEQLRARGFRAHSLAGGMKAWSLAWNTAEVPVASTAVKVIQIRRTGKGCLSYLIGSAGVAAVIDASAEPEAYIQLAAEHGWSITHVLDTHIHADHISRSRLLAEQTGAVHLLPATDRVAYPFQPMRDGDSIRIGRARLIALHTPGHTLESTTYLLDDQLLFTGDTLFLASVGRPDLEASTSEAGDRARLLWGSLQHLAAFPPSTHVLPGHTSAPVPFDTEPVMSSIVEITAHVGTLQLSAAEFVESILLRLPPPPPNHAAIVALNETGTALPVDPTDLEAGANRCAVR